MMDSNIYKIGEFFVAMERDKHFADPMLLDGKIYQQNVGDVFFVVQELTLTSSSSLWVVVCSTRGCFVTTRDYAMHCIERKYWKKMSIE